MTYRRRRAEGQLVLDLEEAAPTAVERARALRRALGLPESLTDPVVLGQVRPILESNCCAAGARADGVHRQAS